MRDSWFPLVCSIVSLFGGVISAEAAFFNIPNGDVNALKNAIIACNNNNEDDVISLTPGSIYMLTTVDNTGADGPNGLPIITAGNGHSVTISGNGATLQRSTAGGTPAFRLLEVSSGSLSVSTLTFANGTAGVSGGGAVFSTVSTVTFTSCTFSNNSVTGAAGANGVSGQPNGSVGGEGDGGAISSVGTLICNSCTFASNSATGGKGGNNFTGGNNGNGGDGKGGAISHTFMNIFLTDCTFNNNSATGGGPGTGSGGVAALYGQSSGGAVYVSSIGSATFDITRNSFNTNTSAGGGNSSVSASIRKAGAGGAVSMDFFGSGSIEDSTFNNNMAHNGGAVFAFDSLFAISGSTFTTNIVTGFAATNGWGGVAYGKGDASFSPGFLGGGTLTSCTLYNNSAVNGGAVASDGANNGTIGLTNCTLKTNTASSSGGNIYGAISLANTIVSGGTPANFGSAVGQTSQGFNISDDAAGGGAGTAPGGFLNATGDKRNTNPLLATTSPADNGGFTPTFNLSNTSPAINQGNDALAPYRDQRGNFRTGRSDIGAVEYNGGLVGMSFIERDGNDAVVSAEVVVNNFYRLERKTNLTDTGWQDLSNTVDPIQATDNDVESMTDLNGFAAPRGFYHILWIPPQ